MKTAWAGFLAGVCLAVGGCGSQPSAKGPARSAPPATPIASTTAEAPPYTEISMKCQGQRVPVIMYHDFIVKRDRKSVWFDCTVDEFEDQMKEIQDHGATPISVDQLYAHLTQGAQVPANAVVLTFDDNYQGFWDYALPILKKYSFPAAVFVHTGFVGKKEGRHPHMTWDELKQLSANPLITIANHTITHPVDITKLSPEEQRHEIADAKADLEQHLGKKVDYFAYPDGANDAVTQEIVRETGHKMAFTVENGPAEESPNIWTINRYVQTRMDRAWDDRTTALAGGVLGIYHGQFHPAPVKYAEVEQGRVKIGLITGGTPVTVLSQAREGVLDFVRRTSGAAGGINGGFFAMAAIASTDNKMVGPCKTADQSIVVPDDDPTRWAKLKNRPLVMWGPSGFAILPFVGSSMHDPAAFADFMPDMTDTFLAGVWLVHGGIARTRDEMNTFASKDIEDPRKRAFMGIMTNGTFVAGASMGSVSSEQLAEAIPASGVQEAVLLDSGFSTSLVYGQSIKAFGHSTPENPSRPVPHAIVIKGDLDPATAALGAPDATPPVATVVEPSATTGHHRHRRRRRKKADDAAPAAAPVLPAPDAPSSPPPR